MLHVNKILIICDDIRKQVTVFNRPKSSQLSAINFNGRKTQETVAKFQFKDHSFSNWTKAMRSSNFKYLIPGLIIHIVLF